jgi:hypothetical protein
MVGSLTTKVKHSTLPYIAKLLAVAGAAEVEVQGVVVETGGVVEGVTIETVTSLEHEKMDKALKEEGLITIRDKIEAMETGEEIPPVVVTWMW